VAPNKIKIIIERYGDISSSYKVPRGDSFNNNKRNLVGKAKDTTLSLSAGQILLRTSYHQVLFYDCDMSPVIVGYLNILFWAAGGHRGQCWSFQIYKVNEGDVGGRGGDLQTG
jgi:hypothetical protein